jgi:Flp pilus assembly protein protease CpaA
VDQVLTFPTAVVLVASLIATATDVTRFKVHNLLTLPLLVFGLAYHGFVGGPPALVQSLLGALLGFGVLVGFYLLGGVGAGDVKLLAAIGAWLGLPLTFYVFIASSLAAGVYALVLVVMHRRLHETWINLKIIWHRLGVIGRHLAGDDGVEAELQRPDFRNRVIPFGAMVAAGLIGLLVYLWLGGTP